MRPRHKAAENGCTGLSMMVSGTGFNEAAA